VLDHDAVGDSRLGVQRLVEEEVRIPNRGDRGLLFEGGEARQGAIGGAVVVAANLVGAANPTLRSTLQCATLACAADARGWRRVELFVLHVGSNALVEFGLEDVFGLSATVVTAHREERDERQRQWEEEAKSVSAIH